MGTAILSAELVDRGMEFAVAVTVADDFYPHLRVRFTFDHEEGTLPLDSACVERTEELMKYDTRITVYELRAEFPWAVWERAARAAAAQEIADRGQRLHPVALESSDTGAFTPRLLEVASEYRANVKAGLRNPAAVIAQKHGVPPATARSWIHRARQLGLLGPAVGRTAGEAGPAVKVSRATGAARGAKPASAKKKSTKRKRS